MGKARQVLTLQLLVAVKCKNVKLMAEMNAYSLCCVLIVPLAARGISLGDTLVTRTMVHKYFLRSSC